MEANEYQKLAARTLIDRPDFELTDLHTMLLWNSIGLCGEAGEVAELAKKQICHQQGLDKEKWKKEIGDVLWYASALCTKLGFSLQECMEINIDKLMKRYPDGYKAELTQPEWIGEKV